MKRNTKLFNDIADVLEFSPKLYNQNTWGGFRLRGTRGAWLKRQRNAWRKYFGDHSPVGGESDSRWLQVQGCDTEMCIAGHAASLNGYHPVIYAYQTLSWGKVNPTPMQTASDSNTEEVTVVAQRLLGLTTTEADLLFHSNSKITSEDLRAYGKGSEITELGYSHLR